MGLFCNEFSDFEEGGVTQGHQVLDVAEIVATAGVVVTGKFVTLPVMRVNVQLKKLRCLPLLA